MFFTREDILKIQQALLQLGVKDSELPNAEPITYDDTLSIVQDGKNKQIGVKDFFNQISLWKREDFLNITDRYDEHYIMLLEAINLVPILQRKDGLVITFQDTNGDWRIYQFRGNITEFLNEEKWFDLYDYKNYIIKSFLPDEEDITALTPDKNGNSFLALKDRIYNPTIFSGKGYKFVRKNIINVELATIKISVTNPTTLEGDIYFNINNKGTKVHLSPSIHNTTKLVSEAIKDALNVVYTDYKVTVANSVVTLTHKYSGNTSPTTFEMYNTGVRVIVEDSTTIDEKNVITQEDINKADTIYEIRYDFDLDGKTITIPNNCVLYFTSGKFYNGSINMNNTIIATLYEDILSEVNINGNYYNIQEHIKNHQRQLDDKQLQIDDKQQQIIANDEDISLLQTRSNQMEETIKSIAATSGASQATAVTYNNEKSKLTAINIQSAVDEVVNKTAIKDEEGTVIETPFRYIQNEEFIFAKVDAEDKLLFGIQWDGTPVFGKTSAVENKLQSQVNLLADKITTILGDDNTTSAIDTLKELKDFFANIDNTQTLTSILSNINSVSTKLEEDIKNLQDTKVDKEEGKSLIEDEVKECFKIIENEEFIKAITDADDNVLFGFYRATGKPYFPLNEMYHVIQNEEYFAAWITTDDKVVLGLRRDGQIIGEIHAVNALKQVIFQLQSDVASLQEKLGTIDTNLKEFLDVFSLQENPEYLAVEKDAEGKVLSATNPDGSHYIHNAKSETIPEELSHIEDPEGRTEIVTDAENKVLAYRDSDGIRHESGMEVEQFYQKGNKIEYATKNYVDTKPIDDSEIVLSRLDGVVDYSLENLFDKNKIRTYDSDFATKVFNAIGRKTESTGCYSNNIPCKEGDWFTRNDFGTGIVVVLDENDNILGDVKNVAYKPTFQIKASENQDFSKAVSVVMVVMLNALDTERIVNAKYVPTKEEDAIRIPKLKVGQENIELGITTYVKGSSGRYYSLNVDDLGDSPHISLVKLEGIPSSGLPSDFPKFTISGSFSEYYKSLVLCPIEGETEYLLELGANGLVTRYLKKKINCPRLIKENGVQYYYGVDGNLNSSSGELNIYKAKDETFELVKGNIRDSEGNKIEPHDCLVLSVNPLHVISQRYVGNQKTIVDGEEKTVTSLHIEEQYNGERVWLWKSEDYPELWKDSHYKGNNEDYLHNNTICIDKDNNLVLNNKQANQILVISRTWSDNTHIGTIGDILWKIGGNRGSNYNYDVATRIKTTTQQQWFECHDAVVNGEGLYTLFDNKESGASRIVEFNIDTENKAVKNFNSFTYQSYRGRYMGSVDKLADGIFLVSWGSFRSAGTPNIGIYDFKNQKKIFELKFESDSYSVYRVYGIKHV